MRSKYLAVIISMVIIFTFSEQAFAWNDPPHAELSVNPTICLVDDIIDFNSAGSYDSDGYIDKYYWKFGDGDDYTEGEPNAVHQYASAGTYTAWLRVVDDDGAPGYDSCTIYVYEKYGPVYVDEDVNINDPCYTGAGDSWANAYQELGDAIAEANEGAVFYVAEGKYFPGTEQEDSFVLDTYMEIQGGFPSGGGERNPVAYPTVLSGDIGEEGDRSDNCYCIVQGANRIKLDGLTIRDANNDQYTCGGGLQCSGDAEIINCIFEDNGGAYYFGGAAYSCGYHNTQKFTNCVFSGNHARYGGAVSNSFHNCYNENTQEFINCVFTDNTATRDGGAVVGARQDDTKFINCTFYGNEAGDEAGGIYSVESTLTVTNCIFWGNTDGDEVTTTEQEQICDGHNSDITVSYSCIQGGWSGTGNNNIDDNPQFADSSEPAGDDRKYLTIDDGLRLQRIYA